MLPPSDAQQLRQAPQTQCLGYSSVDKCLTASFVALRLGSPPSPLLLHLLRWIFTYGQKQGFEGQKFVTQQMFMRLNL